MLQPPGLTAPQTCQNLAANPEAALALGAAPNAFACRPDNNAFRNLVSELGFAIAPMPLRPARSTGPSGFAFTFEANFTSANPGGVSDSGTKYWEQGTRGSTDPSTGKFSTRNTKPDSVLQVYSLRARKGLPMGFELASAVGVLANSSLWVIGGDLRWSLLEGFRKEALGYLPDVSVGTGVRTLVGSAKMYVTAVGIDGQLSKPFTIADSAQLIPFVGYQRLLIFGNSGVIDSTPNVDALSQCGYQGSKKDGTGAPDCKNKLSNGFDANGDFNNTFSFAAVKLHRHRMMLGTAYRHEILFFSTQLLFDLTAPGGENPGIVGDRQWTFSLEGGAQF